MQATQNGTSARTHPAWQECLLDPAITVFKPGGSLMGRQLTKQGVPHDVVSAHGSRRSLPEGARPQRLSRIDQLQKGMDEDGENR